MNEYQMIRKLVRDSAGRQMSRSAIAKAMQLETGDASWTRERVADAWKVMATRKVYNTVLKQGKDGTLAYISGERTPQGTGIYRLVRNVLGGPDNQISKIFGPESRRLGAADVHANRSKADGLWSCPDLLLEVAPPRSGGISVIHSFEFQFKGGATPENVAQAYVSGHGANFMWLLFDAKDRPSTVAERQEKSEWKAVEAVAKKLGVGLISYVKPSIGGTWIVHLRPDRKTPKRDARKALLALASENPQAKKKRA